MANSYEHESESDEDCEVYFLKPVNEYNIVDKIKEANRELFAKDADADVDSEERTQELMELAAAANRKVSFAANLEEYEPQSGISTQQLEKELGKGESTLEHDEPDSNSNATVQPLLEVINEEESPQTETADQRSEVLSETQETEMTCGEEKELKIDSTLNNNDAIDEICEEILIMDMENGNRNETILQQVEAESPGTLHRKMLKQITFDYDEEEQDNKSLTNLLISDNENDETEDEFNITEDPIDFNCNESFSYDTDNDDTRPLTTSAASNERPSEYYEDDEEDDKLSIIVASYLPNDNFDCDKAFLTAEKCTHHNSMRSNKLPFNKRFSFKRKSQTSMNAVASSTQNSNCRQFLPPPEVTDLKLHYKTCCEFKNAQQKLPKYTGYLSEYGLSRDQLEQRELKLEQKHRSLVENAMKATEDDMRKMHDNERAFITWLKNKMRFPINKTRNMFDVKRPFGLRKSTSVSGTALKSDNNSNNNNNNNNNNNFPNTTRYRSISAKFRKP